MTTNNSIRTGLHLSAIALVGMCFFNNAPTNLPVLAKVAYSASATAFTLATTAFITCGLAVLKGADQQIKEHGFHWEFISQYATIGAFLSVLALPNASNFGVNCGKAVASLI